MSEITLPNTGLKTGYVDGASGWGAAMNRNLRILDALVNLTVVDKDLTAPPVATSGATYIVGTAGTGAWAGKSGLLAIWCQGDDIPAGEWAFVTPKEAWRAWVADESAYYRYSAGSWVVV